MNHHIATWVQVSPPIEASHTLVVQVSVSRQTCERLCAPIDEFDSEFGRHVLSLSALPLILTSLQILPDQLLYLLFLLFDGGVSSCLTWPISSLEVVGPISSHEVLKLLYSVVFVVDDVAILESHSSWLCNMLYAVIRIVKVHLALAQSTSSVSGDRNGWFVRLMGGGVGVDVVAGGRIGYKSLLLVWFRPEVGYQGGPFILIQLLDLSLKLLNPSSPHLICRRPYNSL